MFPSAYGRRRRRRRRGRRVGREEEKTRAKAKARREDRRGFDGAHASSHGHDRGTTWPSSLPGRDGAAMAARTGCLLNSGGPKRKREEDETHKNASGTAGREGEAFRCQHTNRESRAWQSRAGQ